MANGTKVKVVKGFWMGLTGTVVNVAGNAVKMVPDCEPDMVGTFNLDELEVK